VSWLTGTRPEVERTWFRLRFQSRTDHRGLTSFFDALFASGAHGVVLQVQVRPTRNATIGKASTGKATTSSGATGNGGKRGDCRSRSVSRIEHVLGVPVAKAKQVASLVRTLLPDVLIEEIEANKQRYVDEGHQGHERRGANMFPEGSVYEAVDIRTSSNSRVVGRHTYEATSASVLSALQTCSEQEGALVQWVLGRTTNAFVVPNKVTDPGSGSWTKDLLVSPFRAPKELDPEARNALIQKVSERRVQALGRLAVSSASITRNQQIVQSLFSALRTSEEAGVTLKKSAGSIEAARTASTPRRFPMSLTAHELASLVLWPLSDGALSLVTAKGPRLLPPSEVPSGKPERTFADTTYPGRTQPLGLPVREALRHLHLLGPTGTGKSTVMLNLIVADVLAGHGVVVVDPKGDLIRDVLCRIPDTRRSDVVVIDAADDQAPVGLNPLQVGGQGQGRSQGQSHGQQQDQDHGQHEGRQQRPSEASCELLADSLLAVFKGLYADSWGPRTEDLLHASLLTLMTPPGATLVGLPLLLTNKAYRMQTLKGVDDPLVLEPFWRWYEGLSEAERSTVIAPLMNKLRAFLLRPSLRRVVGQPKPRFDLRSVFTDQKILLVSLAKGSLGPEGAALLGSLLVSQLWQAAQERVQVPEHGRRPVLIYLDEFQEYLHLPTDLAAVLAQSRSLGVGLTLAHQHLRQLPKAMESAVMANARSRVCFQLSPEDATSMARTTELLEAKDFLGLDAFEIYASLSTNGRTSNFVSARTSPPTAPCSDEAEIRRLSRQSFGVARADIDKALSQLAGVGPTAASPDAPPIGRRR
jgi:Type IV secretion-system coupling protein DNA-binding domain/TraM recognition site of TraD and TraG